MEHKFKAVITRRGKPKEVEIFFDLTETPERNILKVIRVTEDEKEIRNYSISNVLGAINQFLGGM